MTSYSSSHKTFNLKHPTKHRSRGQRFHGANWDGSVCHSKWWCVCWRWPREHQCPGRRCGLRNIGEACALLFVLIYCLNLSYPPDLKCTFEVMQKILLNVHGQSFSKAQ